MDVNNITQLIAFANRCTSLEECHLKNIGCQLAIDYSDKFTHDALMEVIGNLKTVTKATTLYLGTANLAKLSDEEKAIATNKGWTLQ